MNIIEKHKYNLLVIITGILLFMPYLGTVHLFDWDEINFAEAAREMIATGDYLTVRIDYQPFHEKPPLFIWMQVISMKIFGVNEFAARFPNAVTGIITLLVVFSIGKKIYDEKFGILWALAFIGSFLPHFYFRTGIIDPLFNLFIFLGVYYISESYRYKKSDFDKETTGKGEKKQIIIAGIFISLAVLTKGPVGFLLAVMCWLVYWFLNRKSFKFPLLNMIIFTIISAIPFVVWAGMVILSVKSIMSEFIMYQIRLMTTSDAGHGGPIYYHLVILLIGCFPSSIILLQSFRNKKEDNFTQWNMKNWMIILLSVVLIVFSIVKTKIIHYSSLSYFPITFLAAYAIYYIVYKGYSPKKWLGWLIGVLGVVWALLLAAFPLTLMNVNLFLDRVTNKFTHELLKTQVNWSGYEYLLGVFYLIGIILSLVFLTRKKYLNGIVVLYGSTAMLIFLLLPVLAPKIEPYTQGAPIEFYQSLQGKDCYIQPLGYKSYAHYFYSKKPPYLSSAFNSEIPLEGFETWLLTGKISRPAYFACKIDDLESYLKNPGLQLLYTKNGFAFLERKPE